MVEAPEHLYGVSPVNDQEAQTKALNRLALAVEQLALIIMDKQVPAGLTSHTQPPPLAALPPVQVVAAKPACPKHGPDKVSPSSKFAGFFCTAKDESGPRGYCAWQFRTQA